MRLGGVDVRRLRLAELRSEIGVVFEESFLFSDTLRANIAYGRPEATDAEVRAAYDGYLAYWGTFDLDAARGTVTHHVRGSLYPNWVGQDQVRAYSLEGRRLTLRTPPMKQRGREVVGLLTWERLG